MHISRTVIVGLLWASAAIVIWSGSLVMLRLGVTTSLNAYDLTMIRFGVAALVLAAVVIRQGTRSPRLKWWGVLAMVATFGAPYIVLLSLAMKTAPAAAAGALNPGVMAITSVFLGALVFRDKIVSVRFIGLLVTAVGVLAFSLAGGSFGVGYLILIWTGVMWALYALIVRRFSVPALNATAIVAVGSALLYAPIYISYLPKSIFAAPVEDIITQAVFQGVLVSVVAVYGFNRSAECLGPVAGAVLPALIPVMTLVLGAIVLNEIVTLYEVMSAFLVTAGLTLILIGPPIMTWLRGKGA